MLPRFRIREQQQHQLRQQQQPSVRKMIVKLPTVNRRIVQVQVPEQCLIAINTFTETQETT